MIRLVLVAGLLAGLAAGLATAVVQHFTTVPLIMAAEAYEGDTAVASHDHAPAAAGAAAEDAHDHGSANAWAPADGLERTLSTGAATVVSAVGFALMLIAAMLAAGERIGPSTALAWAAGGFAATGLATGLGLPPELPGSAYADLVARQAWWFGAAFATALGLWLLIRRPGVLAKAGGALLLVAPHAIGAPAAEGYASTAPAELAAHFAATSLVVHAVFWALTGAAVGIVWRRLERT
jgi:cobalt transporter subunit CbtA